MPHFWDHSWPGQAGFSIKLLYAPHDTPWSQASRKHHRYPPFVNLDRRPHGQLTCRNRAAALGPPARSLLKITQTRLGDRHHISLETVPDELALYSQACIVSARWNVADQICILRFLPLFAEVGSLGCWVFLNQATSIQIAGINFRWPQNH
jgi:hypothetical protein